MNELLGTSDEVSVSMGRGAGLSDNLGMRGNVRIEVFGPDGALKEEREVHNLV